MKRVGGEGVDYSIWNPKTLTYDYYRAPTALREGVIAPKPKLGSGGRLGLAPEQAARALPAGAVKAGGGAMVAWETLSRVTRPRSSCC
jgi:hypothetical protein